jgi:hypothetical protein
MRIGVVMMDIFVTFFRDVLDGPLYIIVVIINLILICSCIGYLGEKRLKKKEAKAIYEKTYAQVNNPNMNRATGTTMVSNASSAVATTYQVPGQVNAVGGVQSAIPKQNISMGQARR